MFETHRMSPEESSHWSCGPQLGSGCDKLTYAAVYDGLPTDYVIKVQRGRGIFSQVEGEERLQNELLLRTDAPEARAALSRIAYILGIGSMPQTPDDYDYDEDDPQEVAFQICERADMEHDLFGNQEAWKLVEECEGEGVIQQLQDMGHRNYGRRKADGTWICIDWGVCSFDSLIRMGQAVLTREEW